jgi:hypothetical protein
MRAVKPTVVRVLDVPTGVLLSELHDLLQAGLGWTDSHLHQFVAEGICYGMPGTDEPEDERDESAVRLRMLPDRFEYLYDFGDGWEHDVEVVGPGRDRPGVVAGQGACPPEDVGGPHGYADFLQVMADPDHPEHNRLRTWAGSWNDGFDLDAADLLLRQTVGVVPASVRLVLGLAADGVKLTPGGRLPRAIVRQVQESYPGWQLTERPASLEDDLLPLAALHELLPHIGLLRLRNGVLGPTRAAADDTEVIRRLRSWFGPNDSFISVLAGECLASLVVDGICRPEELAVRLLPRLGHGWFTSQGQPLDEGRTRHELYRLESVLVGLDLIQRDKGAWTAGPSALWLLPRAAAVAHLWSIGQQLS